MDHNYSDIKQVLLKRKREAEISRLRKGIERPEDRRPVSGLDVHKVAGEYLDIPEAKVNRP